MKRPLSIGRSWPLSQVLDSGRYGHLPIAITIREAPVNALDTNANSLGTVESLTYTAPQAGAREQF
jgi:hypothetical protein